MKILQQKKRSLFGFALPETLISVAVFGEIMAAVMCTILYCNRSFVAQGNYMELNSASTFALDTMTRDIREVRALQTFATNKLVFVNFDNNALTYNWNPSTKQFTRDLLGVTNVLLTDCDYLLFDISTHSPLTDGTFGFYSSSNNPALCKLVSVSWRCSRSILGQKVNTESVQTAKVAIRN